MDEFSSEGFLIGKLIFDVEGWLTEQEAHMLFECARMSTGDILELGPYCGKSTVAIAAGNELGKNNVFWTVDRFDSHSTEDILEGKNTHEIFWDNLVARNLCKHLQVVIEDISNISPPRALEMFGDEIGFIFHDASHDYASVKHDLEAFAPLLCQGGMLAVHDYNAEGFPGVVKAVSELEGFTQEILVSSNMWVGTKTK